MRKARRFLDRAEPTPAPPNDPGCYSRAEFEKDAVASGGIIAGVAEYDGVYSDVTIIVQGVAEILAFGFKDGCFVGIKPIDLTKPLTAT